MKIEVIALAVTGPEGKVYLMECSECGAIGVLTVGDAEVRAQVHLLRHGHPDGASDFSH